MIARSTRLALWFSSRFLGGLLLAFLVYQLSEVVVPALAPVIRVATRSLPITLDISYLPEALAIVSLIAFLVWPHRAIALAIASITMSAALVAEPIEVATSLAEYLLIILSVLILSNFATRYHIEKYGSPAKIDYSCEVRCKAISLASFIAAYGGIALLLYYTVAATHRLINYVLSYTPPGILAEVWASARETRLVQALVFFTMVALIYVLVSRIITPLGVAAIAPPSALRRIVDKYLEEEAENIVRRKSWYHIVYHQVLGYMISFPVAIVSYFAAVLATPRLAGLLETWLGSKPPEIAYQAIPVATAIAVGTIAYYAGRKVFAKMIYEQLGWGKAAIVGTLTIAGLLAILALIYGYNPLAYAKNLFSMQPLPEPLGFDKTTASILGNITSGIEDSENLLRTLIKLLWG